MNPTEILHKIVETEKEAREVYGEAAALRDGFALYMDERVEALKAKYARQADDQITLAEAEAVARTDKEIARLDKKLETELESAKLQYQAGKGAVIDKMFRLAVNLDA